MKLPLHVIEFKSDLEAARNDKLKRTLDSLTETDDLRLEEDLEKMWDALAKAENISGRPSNNMWVSVFLNAVNFSMEEKPYYSLNNEDRKSQLEKIKIMSERLKELYISLGLNENFLLFNPEMLGVILEDEEFKYDIPQLPSVGIAEVLDFYLDFASEELGDYVQEGKVGVRRASSSFIRKLGRWIGQRYARPLNSVLGAAAFALYDHEYEPADVSRLLKPRKPSK